MSAHDYAFTSIDGKPMKMADFKGKAVLVVNTASQCGLTPQYAGLQSVYDRYKAKGLVVLGVPSNDFGGQEPGSEAEIKSFCATNYKVSFPMTAKNRVIGGDAHPLYKWVVAEAGEAAAPKWNFHKYLIGKDGVLAGTFGSRVAPDAAEVIAAIESVLN